MGLVRGREVGFLLAREFVGHVDENWVFLVVDLHKIYLLVICARSVSLARDSFNIGTRKSCFLYVICTRFVRYVDEKWGSYSSHGTRFVRYADEKRGS
jgi:hypothetical protein